MPHDLGGEPEGAVDPHDHDHAFWEQRVDAIRALAGKIKRDESPLIRVDEMRRVIESLGATAYNELGYYEKWVTAMTTLLLEKGVISVDELGRKLAEIEAREAGT
jgi:hypothetical protein